MIPSDVPGMIDILREVLLKHMDESYALPDYRIQSVVLIGARSGRLMTSDDVITGCDVPGALLVLAGARRGHHL